MPAINEEALKKWNFVTDYQNNQIQHWSKTKPSKTDTAMVNAFNRMMDKFRFYCQQVPILGFNSANYDLNLIKNYLARHLRMHESNGMTIKKNNSYTCVINDRLRFPDITNFLAPGTSYSKFLKGYRIKKAKGFFSYEYLQRFNQLYEKKLPPHSTFYSNLQQKNISEEDYQFCVDISQKQNMTCL